MSVKCLTTLFPVFKQNLNKVSKQKIKLISTMSEILDQIPDVDIDSDGVFKYILINVTDKKSNSKKPIVRGYARAPYHADIYDEVEEKLKKLGPNIKSKCVGGGRIKHDSDQNAINVYGYSQGFGKADHEVSVDLIKKKYPSYEVTWSNEGY
ncbi:14 kDa phosphohistidine phosphatase-like isoform X2 [Leptopilina heterotoma]|uniref:14 kDa phosphohistidine phosphatase-like isoform X2 n=1 Tax=Leptopilina heterotoma TaxID=63436 RepID=UPI001CA8C34B|nr:14 kDa phosphohistidine phosphatase-like isoform X2 [Leptopilina heterotoma]